jgi:transposase-like protein
LEETRTNGVSAAPGVSTEVVEGAGKRRYSDTYKVRIVEEANRCTKPGEVGALLRKEGLYASALARFRKQYSAGVLTGSATKRKVERVEEGHLQRILDLERENRKLKRSLSQAEAVIEVQKKLSDILGLNQEESDGSG